MLDIHIRWEGPYSVEEAKGFKSTSDYGLYQFYGEHILYGQDSLLYFGKAERRTFGERLSEHNWHLWTSSNVSIYVGRVCSKNALEIKEWWRQIDLAERIILQSHNPSFNCSNLNTIGHKGTDTRVLNWGVRRQLLPEVTVSRWEGEFSIGNELKQTYVSQALNQ